MWKWIVPIIFGLSAAFANAEERAPFCVRILMGRLGGSVMLRALTEVTSSTYRNYLATQAKSIDVKDTAKLRLLLASRQDDVVNAALTAILEQAPTGENLKLISDLQTFYRGDEQRRLITLIAVKSETYSWFLQKALFTGLGEKSSPETEQVIRSFQQRQDSESLAALHEVMYMSVRRADPNKALDLKMRALRGLKNRPDADDLIVKAFTNYWTDGIGAIVPQFWFEAADSMVLRQTADMKQIVEKILLGVSVNGFKSSQVHHLYINAMSTAYFKNHRQFIDLGFVEKFMKTQLVNLNSPDHNLFARDAIMPMLKWLKETASSSTAQQALHDRLIQGIRKVADRPLNADRCAFTGYSTPRSWCGLDASYPRDLLAAAGE